MHQVGAVKEAIDERANALIEYQSACCVYDDKVQAMARLVQKAAGQRLPTAAPSREVATHELDVANAAAKRDDAKHRYDSICGRMKVRVACPVGVGSRGRGSATPFAAAGGLLTHALAHPVTNSLTLSSLKPQP